MKPVDGFNFFPKVPIHHLDNVWRTLMSTLAVLVSKIPNLLVKSVTST